MAVRTAWRRTRAGLQSVLRAALPARLGAVPRATGWRAVRPVVRSPRLAVTGEVLVVALVGGLAGLLLAGGIRHDVGPVDARLAVRPALAGGTRIDVAPLGAIDVRSHAGPLRLVVSVSAIRPAAVQRAVADPASLRNLGDDVATDLGNAVLLLALRSLLAVAVGALLLGLLVFRRHWRRTAGAVATAAAVVLGCGAAAVLTWRPQAIAEPRYSGLLTKAPALVGSAQDIVRRFDVYADELGGLVTDVSRLYDVASTLPSYRPDASTIRLLHVSDLHLNPAAWDVVRSIVRDYHVTVVVDTGDLTDHGSAAEDAFARPIGSLGVPYVFIRGNHDSRATERAVRRQRGAVVLDGNVRDVAGLRFFGVGDPRFTPDKTTRGDEVGDRALIRFGQQAAGGLATLGPVDVALAHDPTVAREFAGEAPLLLAGHTHRRESAQLPGSLLLVEGSTGGAGLRGLEGEAPTPLECSVLYVDRSSRRLLAYDDITLGGLGLSSAQVQRHVVPNLPAEPTAEPTTVGDGTPLVRSRPVP